MDNYNKKMNNIENEITFIEGWLRHGFKNGDDEWLDTRKPQLEIELIKLIEHKTILSKLHKQLL